MRAEHHEIFVSDFGRKRRARNDKFRDRARKNSLTLGNNFITHTPNAPSDDPHQQHSKNFCDPHLRIERGDL
ncbi:hypothetical protein [Chthoniobacter sp.]|uniref:hypothetical protein n=1 Tax=Chthoniobacter sp. TaxID=2510640 RepID=UPI0032AFA45F